MNIPNTNIPLPMMNAIPTASSNLLPGAGGLSSSPRPTLSLSSSSSILDSIQNLSVTASRTRPNRYRVSSRQQHRQRSIGQILEEDDDNDDDDENEEEESDDENIDLNKDTKGHNETGKDVNSNDVVTKTKRKSTSSATSTSSSTSSTSRTKCVPKKNVHFNETVLVHIPRVRPLKRIEKNDAFYAANDYIRFVKNDKILIRFVRSMHHTLSPTNTANSNTDPSMLLNDLMDTTSDHTASNKNNKINYDDKDDILCIRGLEAMITSGANTLLKTRRKNIVQAVLKEQDKYRISSGAFTNTTTTTTTTIMKYNNNEITKYNLQLRKVALSYSKACKYTALRRGKDDAKYVRDCIRPSSNCALSTTTSTHTNLKNNNATLKSILKKSNVTRSSVTSTIAAVAAASSAVSISTITNNRSSSPMKKNTVTGTSGRRKILFLRREKNTTPIRSTCTLLSSTSSVSTIQSNTIGTAHSTTKNVDVVPAETTTTPPSPSTLSKSHNDSLDGRYNNSNLSKIQTFSIYEKETKENDRVLSLERQYPENQPQRRQRCIRISNELRSDDTHYSYNNPATMSNITTGSHPTTSSETRIASSSSRSVVSQLTLI